MRNRRASLGAPVLNAWEQQQQYQEDEDEREFYTDTGSLALIPGSLALKLALIPGSMAASDAIYISSECLYE